MTKESSGFDIGTMADTVKASNNGHRFELLSPIDQTKTGIFISVLGRDSDVVRQILRDQIDAAARRALQARTKGKQPPIQTSVEMEREGTDLLVAATLGWENMKVNGAMLEFNPKNALELYSGYPWIRKQVDEAITDIEGFMKR